MCQNRKISQFLRQLVTEDCDRSGETSRETGTPGDTQRKAVHQVVDAIRKEIQPTDRENLLNTLGSLDVHTQFEILIETLAGRRSRMFQAIMVSQLLLAQLRLAVLDALEFNIMAVAVRAGLGAEGASHDPVQQRIEEQKAEHTHAHHPHLPDVVAAILILLARPCVIVRTVRMHLQCLRNQMKERITHQRSNGERNQHLEQPATNLLVVNRDEDNADHRDQGDHHDREHTIAPTLSIRGRITGAVRMSVTGSTAAQDHRVQLHHSRSEFSLVQKQVAIEIILLKHLRRGETRGTDTARLFLSGGAWSSSSSNGPFLLVIMLIRILMVRLIVFVVVGVVMVIMFLMLQRQPTVGNKHREFILIQRTVCTSIVDSHNPLERLHSVLQLVVVFVVVVVMVLFVVVVLVFIG
mmetsp:Transcript_36298/g.91100  ORF Transcript_36298/g.91100 Transcript_36298/m.91100 type:complete len:409 (+) Transcript_36298:391-1617(+)